MNLFETLRKLNFDCEFYQNDPETYYVDMAKPYKWCDHPMVIAACHLFEVDIVVVCNEGNPYLIRREEGVRQSRVIAVGHVTGVHFTYVYELDG